MIGNCKEKGRLSAHITIFCALIFMTVFTLFWTLIQSAYFSATKARIDSACSLAVESAFAGYSNAVFNRYGIFVLKDNADTLKRSTQVIKTNMSGSRASLKNLYIVSNTYMTDNSGEPFFTQAVEYMKKEGAAEYASEKLSQARSAEKAMQKSKEVADIAKECTDSSMSGDVLKEKTDKLLDITKGNEDGIKNINNEIKAAASKEKGEHIQRSEASKKDEDNLNKIKRTLKGDLVSLVITDKSRISGKEIKDADFRYNEKNTVNDEWRGDNSPFSKGLFHEYIYLQFDSFTDVTSGSSKSLDYEIEYIINGKKSDRENLDGVFKKIFAIREGMNFTYLLSDVQKKNEAVSLATSIFGFTMNPLIVKVGEYGILALWAAGESVADLKTLTNGKKLPFIKTKESWQVSLSGLLKGKTEGGRRNNEGGLGYEDYLRLIMTGKTQTECARCMDMIDMYMHARGDTDFKMKNCIAKRRIYSEFAMPFTGTSYTGEYEYSYQ